eukprot:SAG31_NODE_146_length_22601_cov_56.529192_8_plen_162_part_00
MLSRFVRGGAPRAAAPASSPYLTEDDFSTAEVPLLLPPSSRCCTAERLMLLVGQDDLSGHRSKERQLGLCSNQTTSCSRRFAYHYFCHDSLAYGHSPLSLTCSGRFGQERHRCLADHHQQKVPPSRPGRQLQQMAQHLVQMQPHQLGVRSCRLPYSCHEDG